MAPKTTSDFGFHFIFLFLSLTWSKMPKNLANLFGHFFLQIWGQSLQTLKMMQMSYMNRKLRNFVALCGHCDLLPVCQNLPLPFINKMLPHCVFSYFSARFFVAFLKLPCLRANISEM